MRPLRTTTAIVALLGCAGAICVAPAQSDPSDGSGCPQSQSSSGPPPPNQLGRPLNEVVVENCHSGTNQARSRLQMDNASGQDSPTNLAYAYAHDCASGCDAIAAAYQVVLVDKDDPSQTPQNAAVAINQNCTGCGAFAYADQYVVDVPPGTQLDPGTRQQIDSIRRQAAADVRAGLSFSDLDSKLRALAAQLQQDVDNGLAQHGVPEQNPHNTQHENERGAPGPGSS